MVEDSCDIGGMVEGVVEGSEVTPVDIDDKVEQLARCDV